jgi:hypothetical protein
MAGRDFNIHVNWHGGGSKLAFGGSNIAKTSRGGGDTQGVSQRNLRGFAGVGLAFRAGAMGNEIFGAYTENRLQQRKNAKGMTYAKYAVGVYALGPIGVAYMASDLSYRTLQYNIGIQKQSREAGYYKRLSGNNANSGSRYRGAMT